MRRLSLLAAGLALILGAVEIGAVTAIPAAADTTLCDQYGSTAIQSGAYIVQNNRWGTSATQCIGVSSTGFRIVQEDGVAATNGSPTGYPSVYRGCHYGNCTAGFSPVAANSAKFAGIGTSVSMRYPAGGNWDASYDIWFDPTARTNGQNTGAEIMVWLNHSGLPQPIGSRVGTVSLAGGTWDVWEGNIGWNVVSYVRTAGTGSMSFPVSTFYKDAIGRGYASNSWYLTSIQAGFEPWSGGTGLAVTNFAVTTGRTPPPKAAPPTIAPPTITPPKAAPPRIAPPRIAPPRIAPPTIAPPTIARPTIARPISAASCTARLRVTQAWNGGFTADMTVRNTGTVDTRAWRVSWTWPSGQAAINIWNASGTTSGRTQLATDAGYNGALAAAATTTFGFQATGNSTTPTATCAAS